MWRQPSSLTAATSVQVSALKHKEAQNHGEGSILSAHGRFVVLLWKKLCVLNTLPVSERCLFMLNQILSDSRSGRFYILPCSRRLRYAKNAQIIKMLQQEQEESPSSAHPLLCLP
jgi:hypothetical protein